MLFFLRIRNFIGLLVARVCRGCKIRSSDVSFRSITNARNVETLHQVSVDSSSRVGSYSYIGCRSSITRSTIGRYCSIANNVSIGQGEHLLGNISTSAVFYDSPWDTLTAGHCDIASDVWIGVDAVILRGTRVGIGAVIAANAVVTKDVPPFAVVGGAPSRLLKYRFTEEKRRRILQSCWWEKDQREAAEVIRQLEEVTKNL